ncbi:NUDIX hydrolase [Notoacmeibacter ruber]|uniref:NUDIX hydrolase n=1 Tax=Notoacmeibacter ruber TaxID=2670375 RepID=A0A3L7JGV2_9HYPH|nr:NUDIX hydrolase [Notoacmeibacter ruber]RLQ87712.1 NUDIX hydrolase [Notoacmeibacter ruber]
MSDFASQLPKGAPADPRSTDPKDATQGKGRAIRPRDAGTLLVLDRSAKDVRVLVGKRHGKHAFMANRYVFPGGRTDPGDSRVPLSEGHDLRADDLKKLTAGTVKRFTPRRATATALSAVRETYEEAGLFIGKRASTERFLAAGWEAFSDHGIVPDLSKLRFIARAITPPGRVRRFDTRFFACWRDEAVAHELPEGGPTQELSDLTWLPIEEAVGSDNLPGITRIIVAHLVERLQTDSDLQRLVSVPMHFERRGDMVLERL